MQEIRGDTQDRLADMRILKRKPPNREMDYIEMVDSIDGGLFTFEEIILGLHKDLGKRRAFCVRHDVDNGFGDALRFAEIEKKAGIQATYFLLHTARYFSYRQKFLDRCKMLVDLGHDIGLHGNFLAEHIKTGRNLHFSIVKSLEYLRNNSIPILGTAAHGDRLCRRLGFENTEIWDRCGPQRRRRKIGFPDGFEIPKYRLEEFGLLYEAYCMEGNAYLSDSGAKWQGYVSAKPRTFLDMIHDGEVPNVGLSTINEFNKLKSGILQVLVHPCWWRIT